ncbi:MAG: infB, partial [Solirubrobacterales bacterium]|nr:infB [Solirubrobacterales bacterium]
EEAAAKAAAEAEAAAVAAAGATPDAAAKPATPEAKDADKDGKPALTIGDKPDAGRGPKILAVPEPPKRPKRDESQNLPGGRKGAPTTGAAGRRRVVIDSQAARRGPGGPGGPGGPVNQPPRRQRRGRRRRGTYNDSVNELDVSAQTSIDLIKINSGSTVKDVAEYLGVPVPDVIKKLMMLGEMATLTQTLSDDAIQVIADEFDREIEIVHAGDDDDVIEYDDDESDLVYRPPVVTIMGHVDHGKTSLLDAVRQADVVGGESGGITQHIGAYQVHHNGKVITFLDTPGHEAFTAMRARGARVTDIAVIVVAADDGVMPQTEEAIDHAKAADVPIVVAVNKIDKEGSDPTRVRTEMTTRGLQPSDWGGDTEYVDVSAKAKLNLEDLLDTILVVAELEDLKANPDAEASGVVIESKLDPGRGPVVTVLIQRGTLRVGDALLAGPQWGKVRAMHDYTGARIKQAVPGDPVEILGFDGVPDAGETVRVVENDKQARSLAGERGHRLKTESLARRSGRKVSLDDVFKRVLGSEYKELNLIVKVDVAGSLEAIEDEIAKLPQQEVQVNIIHSGVGGITESDVMLATASDAAIMGFNVRPVGDARAAADREGVEILNYSVIYKAMDDLRDAMEGMLDPEEVEDAVGEVEVRQIFRASKIGIIAGCMVTSGKVTRGAKLRVVRDGRVVTETKIDSLKRFNEDVREVASGFECGITLAGTQDIQEGDVFEVFATRKVDRVLAR